MAKQVKFKPRQSPGKFLQISSSCKAQAQTKPKPRQNPSPGKAQAQTKPKPKQSQSPAQDQAQTKPKVQTQEQNNNFWSKIKISPPPHPHLTASSPFLGQKLYAEVLVTRTRLYLSLTVMAFSLTVLLAERSVGCSSYRRQYKNVQGSYR